MNLDLHGRALDDTAIERLRAFEQNAVEMHPGGYYVGISGGKDSDVIYDLVKRAGVRAEFYHHLTTVDPPEAVRHVRHDMPGVILKRPPISMAALIRKKKAPPRRQARFCCEYLKENGGYGRMVVTGVRWAESSRRGRRKMVEICYRKRNRRFLNVIIDWSTPEVWQYIRERGLKYCELYDQGWERIGCILCPMTRDVKRQMERWPAIARVWERAIKSTWDPNKIANPKTKPKNSACRTGRQIRCRFRSPEHLWQWWLDRDAPAMTDDPVLFEDDPGLA